MDKELKQKWLDALRSGKYKQTQYVLEYQERDGTITGNCCLGVLCRVAGIEPEISIPSRKGVDVFVCFEDAHESLNGELRKKFGLSLEEEGDLIQMNDADSASFSEIADWIETYV